jgi:hypothetical protein
VTSAGSDIPRGEVVNRNGPGRSLAAWQEGGKRRTCARRYSPEANLAANESSTELENIVVGDVSKVANVRLSVTTGR